MSEKHTHRDEGLHRSLLNRLSRVEGQVRGIKSMVEDDVYCIDIMNQVAAVRSALASFSKVLLESHLRTCVRTGIGKGEDDVIDELVDTVNKLIR